MGIVLTFIVNAVLNLGLGLAVAAVLGLEQYGRFALASVLTFMLAGGLFEWLRLATTRFYGEAARQGDPAIRATLNVAYLGISVALAAVAGLLVAFGLDWGMAPALAASACIAGAASGLFEYKAALARARFLNRTYTALVIVKNIASLTLMVGAGYFFQDAVWVLAALTLAVAISLVPVERALRDPAAAFRLFDAGKLRSFAHYGLPIVAGNVVYQLILLANRSMAVAALGYAESGKLSLATDLGLRLFVSVGAALDVLLFQLAVRADASGGRAQAHAQIARNMVLVLGVLTPLAFGFIANLPAFEAVFVPQRFGGDFAALGLVLVPGIWLFCLGQFAFSPVFQLQGRTLPLVMAALVSLVCDMAGLALLPAPFTLTGLAVVHAVSLATGFVATAVLALQTPECRPAWREVAAILAATAVMLAIVWPLRAIANPLLEMAASGLLGGVVYAGLLLAFDVARARQWLLARWPGARKLAQAKASLP